MSHNVPPAGPNVFPPVPGDKRPAFEFRVGNKIIYGRLPGPSCGRPWKEPEPEIIDMAARQIRKKPLMPDPYHLDD